MICTVAIQYRTPEPCGKDTDHARHRYGWGSEGRDPEGYYHAHVPFPPDTPDEWALEAIECIDCGAQWERGMLETPPSPVYLDCKHDGTVVRISLCCGSPVDGTGFCPECGEHV